MFAYDISFSSHYLSFALQPSWNTLLGGIIQNGASNTQQGHLEAEGAIFRRVAGGVGCLSAAVSAVGQMWRQQGTGDPKWRRSSLYNSQKGRMMSISAMQV